MSVKHKKRPSAEVRAQEEMDEELLYLNGFWVSDDGYRHRSLAFPWPRADAKQLVEESEAGGQDVACRLLRGEL